MHDLFEYRPFPARPGYAWPGKARLALAFVVSIEYYEMRQAQGAVFPASLPGGFGRGPYPDFRSFSHRDYGNRVGIFRIIELFRQHGLRATAALDAANALERPEIVEACMRQDWEIAAHGEAVTRLLSSRLEEAEERRAIRTSLDAVERATGRKALGWHGPESGESARTPQLLAELGVQYVLDWPNDELPYEMQTAAGTLVSIPMAIDLDDVFAHWHRKLSMPRWVRAVSEAVDRLLDEGEARPRLLVLNLHPWLIGQPWRASYLVEVLAGLRKRDRIWFATTAEIARWHAGRQAAGPEERQPG
jgi:peptidoglycan/xylan/chitin deacetylase (PgdA/CDA1 family)